MKKTNFNSMMKTAKVATVLFLSMLPLGAISMSLVACNNDDNEESPEVIDRSPAQAIDLGLPSGTLWASCNVGATKPEEYGDYFAWGETKPKSEYSLSTYKWCNGSVERLTKYCNDKRFGNNGLMDNKTELDLEDDAAYVNWGSNWRMPSFAQIKELINNCTWEWMTVNGVNGDEVKSKKNQNSIFLPAAGWHRNSEFGRAGSVFLYWSRSLDTGVNNHPFNAYRMGGNSEEVTSNENEGIVRTVRDAGLSVRPVRQ